MTVEQHSYPRELQDGHRRRDLVDDRQVVFRGVEEGDGDCEVDASEDCKEGVEAVEEVAGEKVASDGYAEGSYPRRAEQRIVTCQLLINSLITR